MDSHVRKINRNLVAGWMIIVGILFFSYMGEVLKGQRSFTYLFEFMIVTAVPALICLLLYLRKPDMFHLRYYIVVGYFFMYVFSMVTGSTGMVFCYILPMLSFLVLYHQPGLILWTGIAAVSVNLFSIGIKVYSGTMTVENSKDAEIQIALLFLCFGGSYVATRLYDRITNENAGYLYLLDEKNNQIQRMTLQTITTIANTIDAKDEYTKGHSKRVSEYSAAIAEELGLSEDEVQNIRSVGLLHDIGKIGVPDSVLNKPGRLTEEEYQLMKQHTVTGGEILKDIGMMPGIDIGAKYHHERYDGKGYPEGLKGEEIPFIARIISVADAYDAMTSNRVYRKQLASEKVMEELEKGIGTQFDPEIAETMIRLLKEGRLEHLSMDSVVGEKEIEEATTILSRVMEKNERRAVEDMLYDDLTGVYNHSSGEHLMKKMLREKDCCLMFMDLDHFRKINTVSGFVRGDLFLKETVEGIRRMKKDILISRFGGDEFVVLFEDMTSENEAIWIAEQFIQDISQKAEKSKELSELSVSIGIVMGKKGRDSYSSLIQKADKALYFAKEQGGGIYYLYREDVRSKENGHTDVDMTRLIRRLKGDSVGDERFTYEETKEAFEIIKQVVEENNDRVCLLLFTIENKEGKSVPLDERDRVMGYLEQSILNIMRKTDVMAKYSSTQRVLVLADLDEEAGRGIVERILKSFFRMYDKKDLVVHYNMADMSQISEQQ